MKRWILFLSVFLIAGAAFVASLLVFLSPPKFIAPLPVTFEESGPVPPPLDAPSATRLLFVGDVMLGRHVETLANRSSWQVMLEDASSDFSAYDFVMANLEGPVPERHVQTPDYTTNFSFSQEAVEALHEAGVDAVTLANNHTFDKGESAFLHTESVLAEVGLKYVGHPVYPSEGNVLFEDFSGQRLAFLGFNDVFGVLDVQMAADSVEAAAASADVVIVNLHWGDEYVPVHNNRQESVANALFDAGADIIIGHHPHVVQDVAFDEQQGQMVFYSLGNFLFDQYFSVETQEGYAVEITLETDGSWDYRILDVDLRGSVPDIF